MRIMGLGTFGNREERERKRGNWEVVDEEDVFPLESL
jgi:hypothetical protein